MLTRITTFSAHRLLWLKKCLLLLTIFSTLITLSTILLPNTTCSILEYDEHAYHLTKPLPDGHPEELYAELENCSSWIIVRHQTIYMFSAYLDTRFELNFVRILGFSRNDDPCPVYCTFWFENKEPSCGRTATIKQVDPIPTPGTTHWEYYYLCSLDTPDKPLYVTLTATPKCGNPKHRINITSSNTQITSRKHHNFVVCIPPRFHYDNIMELIECLETNRILGASLITIYNHSISSSLDEVLGSYQKEGLVEVIKWTLPQALVKGSHYFGQILAMNDCVYRNMNNSHYIVLTDTDEFIIPHGEVLRWDAMMNHLHDSGIGSYLFKHVSFRPNGSENTNETNMKLNQNLSNQSKINTWVIRQSKPTFPKTRSKVIVVSKAVVRTRIHMAVELVNGFRQETVDPSVGLLHHYRPVPYKKGWSQDTTTLLLHSSLNVAITNRLKSLNTSFIKGYT